jgi:hypothetical protein
MRYNWYNGNIIYNWYINHNVMGYDIMMGNFNGENDGNRVDLKVSCVPTSPGDWVCLPKKCIWKSNGGSQLKTTHTPPLMQLCLVNDEATLLSGCMWLHFRDGFETTSHIQFTWACNPDDVNVVKFRHHQYVFSRHQTFPINFVIVLRVL